MTFKFEYFSTFSIYNDDVVFEPVTQSDFYQQYNLSGDDNILTVCQDDSNTAGNLNFILGTGDDVIEITNENPTGNYIS